MSDEAVTAFRSAVVNEDLNIRDQIGTELDEFQVLLQFGDKAVEPLLALLADENDHVVYTTAQALYYFASDSRVVEPLIVALQSPHPDIRAAAGFSLGATGHVHALNALVTASRDPEPDVRFQAIQALRSFEGCRQAIDAIAAVMRTDDEPENRLKAAGFLEDMGAFTELKAAIDDGLDMEKKTVAATLGEVGGDGAFEHLVLLLRSGGNKEEQEELLACALELWEGDQESSDFLADCMQENDAYDQREAALALGKLGDLRAVTYLRSAIQHPHWMVRSAAAQAFYMLDGDEGAQSMVALLESPDDRMLSWAGPLGFGSIGDRRVNDALFRMLASHDRPVRHFAAKELAQTGDTRAIEPLRAALSNGELWAFKGLKNLGFTGPISELAEWLNSPEPQGLWCLIEAVAAFPDPRALQPLIKILQAEDQHAAGLALQALGTIADPCAAEALADVLECSNDVRLRRIAGWALSRIGTAEAEQVLSHVLSSGDIAAASGAHAYYIAKSQSGSEHLLLDALTYYGHRAMAEDYANSGNPILADAGRRWLEDHPFMQYQNYEPWGMASGVKWADCTDA